MRKSNAIRLRDRGEENEVLEWTREVGAGERADGTLGTPLLQWACMPDSPFPFGQRSEKDGDGPRRMGSDRSIDIQGTVPAL